MKKQIKQFTGKRRLLRKVQIFISEKIRRGWVTSAIQKEIVDVFGLFIPETFICC